MAPRTVPPCPREHFPGRFRGQTLTGNIKLPALRGELKFAAGPAARQRRCPARNGSVPPQQGEAACHDRGRPHGPFLARPAGCQRRPAGISIKIETGFTQGHRTLPPTVRQYPQSAPSFIFQSFGLAQALGAWCDAGEVPNSMCIASSRRPGWTPSRLPSSKPNKNSNFIQIRCNFGADALLKAPVARHSVSEGNFKATFICPPLAKGRSQLGVLGVRCIIT